jgi:RiboL-PSP-HEPN
MSQSSRFKILVRELTRLRKHLLPRKFEETEVDYSDRKLSYFIAYRVLAHAEIESYLEDIALEAARYAIKAWKEREETHKILLSLLAFSGRNMEPPPVTLSPMKGSKTLSEEKFKLEKKIDLASNSFNRCIKENHGLKEQNILALLLPIGIDVDDLDPSWLTTMNTFGESRGIAAHTSASSYKVTQPPNPKIEYDTITDILKGLKDIDQLINKLMKK